MRKIYTIICSVLICQVSFGQINPEHILTSKNTKEYVSNVKIPKSVAPFWSEDFASGVPTTWTNSPAAPWAYRGPSTSPNQTVGSEGAWSGNGSPIQSLSAGNGFMIFDSDYYDNGGIQAQSGNGTGMYPSNGSNAPNGHTGLLTTGPIDCSLYPAVSLIINSYYRQFAGVARVAFSIDGGLNFIETMDVHPGIDVNSATDQDAQVMLNLPASIAGQPDVRIQFIYDGSVLYGGYKGYYFWMIDDIQLIETPANLLTCEDEIFGGWWLGYQTTGDLGCNYTFNPMLQAMGNPYRMEAVIKNTGANSQYNVKLNSEIADDMGTVLFTDMSNPITLNSSESDTLATSNSFIPSVMGIHNISLWATSDSFPTTDTATMTTIVTDSIYGIDYDWNSDGTGLGTSYWPIGRSCGGQVGATAYDIYNDAQVTSISFHVGTGSQIGAEMTVELFEGFGTNAIFLAESDPYQLTNSDLGSWVTIPLLNPTFVNKGTGYMAAIHGRPHPTDTFTITAISNPASSGYIQDNGCDIGANPFGTWYTTTSKMAIRMNFGTINKIDENQGFDFNIFPNPSNGIFTVSTELNASSILVSNVLGQEVYFNNSKGINSQVIDLSKFDKGIYMVKVQYDNQVLVKPVIVE